MKAAILYSNFFDHGGTERRIGGIETYLLNLADVCQAMGIEPTIYQWAKRPFDTNVNDLKVTCESDSCMAMKHKPQRARRCPSFFVFSSGFAAWHLLGKK